MSTILIIANHIFGPKLRFDLDGLGHTVWSADRSRLMEADISHSPDLVILDADATEEEDLSALCRVLRGRETLRRAPILAVVGDEKVRSLDFSSGIDDFLVKPYDVREMETRIRLML